MDPRGARLGTVLIFIGFIAILLPFNNVSSDPTRQVSGPTIDNGAFLTWSYLEKSPDGTAWRQGTQTASVSTGTWKSEDVFIISGSIDGEYHKTDADGDESGNWIGYYRQSDMALMRSYRDLHITIDGMTTTASNESESFYDIPYFRWVKFPLSLGPPPTKWEEEVRETGSWTITSGDTTLSTGTLDETYNHFRYYTNETSISVEAGTYDVHGVRDIKEDLDFNQVHDSTLYYSEDVGWWVKWVTYTTYESENVLVQELELISVSDNSPPITSAIPDIEINEDEIYSDLDPNTYFTDPDGDPLDFEAVDTSDLEVSVSGSNVEITPPSDQFGTYRFNLTATDGKHDPVMNPVTVIISPVDDPPQILEGSVDPVQGNADTLFTFSATVKDIEGDEPPSVEVIIDGSPKTMTKINGDINIGAEYEWSGKLGTEDHRFHFESGDSRFPSSGEINGPQVISPEAPQLYDPDLDVEEGGTSTLCTFTIKWKDQMDRDVEVYLVIDDEDTLEMVTDDTDASGGLTFTMSRFLVEGSHYYHFEAHVDDEVIRYPTNNFLQGPDIYDPHIIGSGYWPEDPVDGDEVTFYVHIQYGHGIFPDVQKLIVDDDEYTLSIESGDLVDGMNLTRKVKMEKGSHSYGFLIEIDGIGLSPASRTMTVSSGPDQDDDIDIDTSNEGKPSAFIVVLLIIVLIIVGVVAFFIVRKRKPPEPMSDEFEEDEASEGHVDGIRGL